MGVTPSLTTGEQPALPTHTPTATATLPAGFGEGGANLPALTATADALAQGTKVQAYVNAVNATRTADALVAAPTRAALTQTAAARRP